MHLQRGLLQLHLVHRLGNIWHCNWGYSSSSNCHIFMFLLLWLNMFFAVDSFLNPGVFIVIAKLQKAEIRLCPFPEPPNPGVLWHPQHPR